MKEKNKEVIREKKEQNKPKLKRYFWKEYKWIVSFIRPYKQHVFWLLLCGLFLTLSELAIPKAFQYLIDDLLPQSNVQGYLSLMLGIMLVVAIMVIATGIRNIQQRLLREKAARDLQYTTFQKLRELGFSYVEKSSTGEILSILNTDVADVQKIYKDYFPNILQNILTIILVGVMLLYMNWQLTMIVIPCYFLYYIVGPWVEKQAFIYLKKYNEHRVDLEKHVYETVSAMQELRAYDALKWRMNSFLKHFQHYNRNWVISVFYAHSRGSIRRFTVYLAVLVLFWIGANQVRAEVMSVGEFVAFFFYFMLLMFTITFLVTNLTEQQTLMIQAARLYHFHNQNIEVSEAAAAIDLEQVRGELNFENVSYAYIEGHPVIQSFNTRIRVGENIGIVGESGCGKSTLLKLIGRFYDPQLGKIILDGHPIEQLSFSSLRNALGFVFQECYLFGTSVKENIRFGHPEATDNEIIEAAKKAHAHQFIMQLPQGYDTPVGERGYKLSGGQKQRIAIARMFIKNPAIVILDEATAALDNESEGYVQQAIEALCKNRTTITVAHRLSTVEHCDRILMMQKGCIIEDGSYQQLMKLQGEFWQLAKSREESHHVTAKI